MKKNRILLLLTLAFLWVNNASAELLTGHVLLNGKQIPAQYTKLTSSTVALGSGYNACISQYSEGRVNVPSTVKIGSTTYRVTEVKSLAFRLCSKITFINFGENITRIGDFACVGCYGLDEIELPTTLESIGSGAFIDLPKLRSVVCMGATPPRWEYNDVFNTIEGGISGGENYRVRYTLDLSIPEAYVETYRNAFYSDTNIGWTHPVGWGSFQAINDEYLENFRIYTTSDLVDLRQLINGEKYSKIQKITLENDLDMSESAIWSSGIGDNYEMAFSGEFDGQNHTISNMKVINPEETYIGLFGWYGGSAIKNLRMKDCEFEGGMGAGALAGFVGRDLVIDNVYLENVKVSGHHLVGGFIGNTSRSSVLDIQIQNSVVGENCVVKMKEDGGEEFVELYNPERAIGGLVGFAEAAQIKYCAMIALIDANYTAGYKVGPFVGTGKWKNYPSSQVDYNFIDYSYSARSDFQGYNPTLATDHIRLGDHVVIGGRDTYRYQASTRIFDATLQYFEVGKFFGCSNMQTFFMAPILGLDHWCYKMGEYPLPVPMEDFWPVEKNVFTLRPKDLPTDRVNGLSLLDEDVPEMAWHNFRVSEGDERAIYYHNFKTSRLWFDETIEKSGFENPEMLPLGLGTITATDGIEYSRELRAKDLGAKYIDIPQYEFDEEKQEFVKGDDGNPIETGEFETVITDEREFEAMGYSVYQPYSMKIPSFTKVYQPHSVKTKGDVTTVAFKQIEGDEIKAFTPYYIVVEQDTISLSTEAETLCPQVTQGVVDLGNYEFLGSNEHLDKFEAMGKSAYILQNDGKWHRVTVESPDDVYIPAFRSFFCTKIDGDAKPLSMVFGDLDDATDIDQIKTIDLDGTERYFDLNGRLLNGKPTKRGIYIQNGKKIMIK